RDGIRRAGRATAETRHRLHQLRGRVVRTDHRCGRRIDSEAAELPIQADRTQQRGSRDLVIGDVVDPECAGVDVAQHEVGPASATDRSDASELQSSPTVPKNAALVSWLL